MVYKISLWTPLPPIKSGVADYIIPLLPYLSKDRDLEIFIDDNYLPEKNILNKYKIFPYEKYAERNDKHPFELNIYQLGNNIHHLYIYNQLLKIPGLVISHDLSISMVLHHYYAGIRNDFQLFKNEFEYSEGKDKLSKANNFIENGENENLYALFATSFMMRRVVERNYAITSHLDYTAKILKENYKAKNVFQINHFAEDPYIKNNGQKKEDLREKFGLEKNNFIIGIFGFLQKTKNLSVSLQAFKRITKLFPNTNLLLVGELNPADGYDEYFYSLANDLGIREKIIETGYVNEDEFRNYIIVSDLIVVLRWPSFGQMSGTIARAIASGRPLIVTDVPEWRSFPDNFCWRVPPEDVQGSQLESLVTELIKDPELLKERGENARHYFENEMSLENIGPAFSSILDDTHGIILESEEIPSFPEDVPYEHNPIETLESSYNYLVASQGKGINSKVGIKLKKLPLFGKYFYLGYRLFSYLNNFRSIFEREQYFELQIKNILMSQYNIIASIKDEIRELDSFVGVNDPISETLVEKTGSAANSTIEGPVSVIEVINKIDGELSSLQSGLRQATDKFEVINKINREVDFLHSGLKLVVDDIDKIKQIEESSNFLQTELDDLLNIEANTLQLNLNTLNTITEKFGLDNDKYSEKEIRSVKHQYVFRGPENDVHRKLNVLLEAHKDYFASKKINRDKPVIDIGCGRGELLELLNKKGFETIGIELNSIYIDYLKKKKLIAVQSDGLKYLKSVKNSSLLGVAGIHIIEHLQEDYLYESLVTMHKKTSKGGFVLLETPNPYCAESMKFFYSDPTHNQPIPSDLLLFLLNEVGYKDLKLIYTEPISLKSYHDVEDKISLYQDYSIFGIK